MPACVSTPRLAASSAGWGVPPTRPHWAIYASLLSAWAAIIFLLITPALHWFAQTEQTTVMRSHAAELTTTSRAELDELYEQAVAYNQQLATGLGEEYLREAGFDYHRMLRTGTSTSTSDVIARVVIPKIDVDQPVRHTFNESSLRRGLGHAQGSSLPVGGDHTHAVIGGHRGLATSIGFTRLPELVPGDEFAIDTLGRTLHYRIIDTATVDPASADVRPIVAGKDLVTLLTCTPLAVNSHRFVATAERIPEPAQHAADQHENMVMPAAFRFPWWMAGMTAITLALLASLKILHRPHATDAREDPAGH